MLSNKNLKEVHPGELAKQGDQHPQVVTRTTTQQKLSNASPNIHAIMKLPFKTKTTTVSGCFVQ